METEQCDEIIVSTDDLEIADLAHSLGCSVHKRASDDGKKGTQEIARRAVQWSGVQHGTIAVVYPCSPMLRSEDLLRAMREWSGSEKPFAVSHLPDGTDAGCFYFGWAQAFRRAIPLNDETVLRIEVPDDRFIDINTAEDLAKAEAMFDNLMEKT